MDLKSWLEHAGRQLQLGGIGSAQLDALILLEDELKKNRAYLLAHPELEISKAQISRLDAHINRRLNHEPLAYVRGFSEFYGRKFLVDKRVLEPRPESETMVELLLEQMLEPSPTIIDVGTGSGALAITAKLEIPAAEVVATDIDKNALAVAKQNAVKLKAKISFFCGDLLEPVKKFRPGIILANLPYLPSHWQLHPSITVEPRVAFLGGKDGLDPYRRLFKQLIDYQPQPKYILTESLPPQHKQLTAIALASGYRLKKTQDLIQVFKS